MSLRQLAGETVVYGLSSILGRFANFLLVPLYTWVLLDQEFGDIAYFYALMGLLKVFFTLQLDTAFFRFGRDPATRSAAYRSILRPALAYMSLLGGAFFLAAPLLAEWTGYPSYTADFRLVALILYLDAFTEFPLARWRLEQRALRFALVRLAGIGLNILANVLFLVVLPAHFDAAEAPWLYPDSRLTLVLLANLAASGITFLLVSGDLRLLGIRGEQLPLRPILGYAAPLLVVSLAGVINEMLDRQLLRYLLPGTVDEVRAQIGIYSANYRLAMIIALFTQAFRYAAEPFFFRVSVDRQAPTTYAKVTRFYTLAASAGLLAILLFIDWLKLFIGPEGSSFHEGLVILPVLLLANLLLGLYYNFSVWYKLTDRTGYGAWIALTGAALTIGLNVLLIPRYGFHASAWTTLVCYVVMTGASLFWGQRHYPVPYPLPRMGAYVGSALVLGLGWGLVPAEWPALLRLVLAGVLMVLWIATWLRLEWPQIRRAY